MGNSGNGADRKRPECLICTMKYMLQWDFSGDNTKARVK